MRHRSPFVLTLSSGSAIACGRPSRLASSSCRSATFFSSGQSLQPTWRIARQDDHFLLQSCFLTRLAGSARPIVKHAPMRYHSSENPSCVRASERKEA